MIRITTPLATIPSRLWAVGQLAGLGLACWLVVASAGASHRAPSGGSPGGSAPRSLAREAAPVEDHAGDEPIEVDWALLAELDLETGEMSPRLREAVGSEVMIPGFMVPLEDSAGRVTEFLLVPYFGACVHTPPPPANQLVHVRMAGARPVAVDWWNPVWVHGVLALEVTENIYSEVSYLLTAERTRPYEW